MRQKYVGGPLGRIRGELKRPPQNVNHDAASGGLSHDLSVHENGPSGQAPLSVHDTRQADRPEGAHAWFAGLERVRLTAGNQPDGGARRRSQPAGQFPLDLDRRLRIAGGTVIRR